MSDTYKVVRFFARDASKKRTILRGLTLAEAQAHCNDPQSASDKCTTKVGRARTKKHGPWFDGWYKE